jgi:predicted O-methyltransferase YrrM
MRVQWLWSPTEEELLTTRFMRNRALFETLAGEVIPRLRQRKQAPLRILFWAASTGCEAYTLRLLLRSGDDEIHAADISEKATHLARLGQYEPWSWHSLLAPDKSLLTPEEVDRLFDEGVVRSEYRQGVRFVVADLFAGSPEIRRASYDVVVCNNLLLHLSPGSAREAIRVLTEYMEEEAVLVLSGCDPLVRAHASRLFGLWPYPEHQEAIQNGWDGVSCAWDLDPRPVWATPPVAQDDPDRERKTCEVYLNFDPSRLSTAVSHRIPDEVTLWLWEHEPRLLEVPSLEELFECLVYRAGAETVPALYQHSYYPYYCLLAHYLGARSILEIGTRFGYSLIALARGALAAAPAGPSVLTLKSLDLEDYPNEFPVSSQEVAKANFDACVTRHRGKTEIDIQFVVGDSHQVRLPPGEGYDLIHVDGDHTEEGAFRDMVDYFPHVEAGGCMVVDDLDQAAVYRGYLRAVEALGIAPEDRAFLPTKHGLGILRARKTAGTTVLPAPLPAPRRPLGT